MTRHVDPIITAIIHKDVRMINYLIDESTDLRHDIIEVVAFFGAVSGSLLDQLNELTGNDRTLLDLWQGFLIEQHGEEG